MLALQPGEHALALRASIVRSVLLLRGSNVYPHPPPVPSTPTSRQFQDEVVPAEAIAMSASIATALRCALVPPTREVRP